MRPPGVDTDSLSRLQRLQVATDMCDADTERRELLLLRTQCFVEAQGLRCPDDARCLAPLSEQLAAQMADVRQQRQAAGPQSSAAAAPPRVTYVPPSSSAEHLVAHCPALAGALPSHPPALAAALQAAHRWAHTPAAAAVAAPAAMHATEARSVAEQQRPPAFPPAEPPQPQAVQPAGRAPAPTNPAWTSAKRKAPPGDGDDDEVIIVDPPCPMAALQPAPLPRKGRPAGAAPASGGPGAAPSAPAAPLFVTAAQKFAVDQAKKGNAPLAAPPAGISAPFQPPGQPRSGPSGMAPRPRGAMAMPAGGGGGGAGGQESDAMHGLPPAIYARICPNGEPVPEAIKKCEPLLVERICGEVLEAPKTVTWDDIAGLEHAKAVVQEVAVWPLKAPHLFRGARAVPAGVLLFGPPGTGKTLLGRAIASQAGATFFSISASSLGSKWIGEGEKLVRALFAVAAALSPSVVFIDEIDSILTARRGGGGDGGEHESSRRLKTELLVQMEGVSGGGTEDGGPRVLLVGATNRPHELDEAARRRLAKQVYIPLPCGAARRQIVTHMLGGGGVDSQRVAHSLSPGDLDKLCGHTDGYSGSDMKHLVQEAARAPLRELRAANVDLADIKEDKVRPITLQDFRRAAKQVRPSVTASDIQAHEEWNKRHGAQASGTGAAAPGAESDGDDW